MKIHHCPKGVAIDVNHDHYISTPHEPDKTDFIGASYWKGIGFKIVATCATCGNRLGARNFQAIYDRGELLVEERP